MYSQSDYIIPSTRRQALIGTLPCLAFGFLTMIGEKDHGDPLAYYSLNLAFSLLLFSGLLIGWIREFPLWSYNYLGWSLFFLWIGSNGRIDRIPLAPPVRALFLIMVLIALIWTRSIKPINKLLGDIWNDWTRLSLVMFALVGFAWIAMAYDENHHPQLLWFILAATLLMSAGTWLFLRSTSMRGRILSLIGSFFVGDIISQICYATWDYRAYYGLPESTRTWYQSLGLYFRMRVFWLTILFWPVMIAAIRKVLLKIKKTSLYSGYGRK
jgi:hypothetical protein